MSASERAIVHAQLALVKAMEGSFAAAHRWLYRWDDRMSIDAELQLVDEGVQQLRVITNLLAMARRVVVRQQQTIDVLSDAATLPRASLKKTSPLWRLWRQRRYAYVLLRQMIDYKLNSIAITLACPVGSSDPATLSATRLAREWSAHLQVYKPVTDDRTSNAANYLQPHLLLPHLNPDWFTFLVPAYPGYSGKVAVKRLW